MVRRLGSKFAQSKRVLKGPSRTLWGRRPCGGGFWRGHLVSQLASNCLRKRSHVSGCRGFSYPAPTARPPRLTCFCLPSFRWLRSPGTPAPSRSVCGTISSAPEPVRPPALCSCSDPAARAGRHHQPALRAAAGGARPSVPWRRALFRLPRGLSVCPTWSLACFESRFLIMVALLWLFEVID